MTLPRLPSLFGAVLSGALGLSAPATHAEPSESAEPVAVLTSIKPLALIVKEAFGPLVEVQSLLPPNVSPHSYALKPSDIRQLAASELFVWIGPGMESFMPAVLKKAPPQQTLALIRVFEDHAPELLLRYKAFGNPAHAHDDADAEADDGHDGHEDDHAPGQVDSHLWLGRRQALESAQRIGDVLKQRHPHLTAKIDQRLSNFAESLSGLPPAPDLAGVRLVSYHNGFAYLMNDLNLQVSEVVVTQSDLTPGARHFGVLRDAFQRSPHCLINEPQFGGSRLVDKLATLAAQTVTLDPMGQDSTRYTELYRGWVEALGQCAVRTAPST